MKPSNITHSQWWLYNLLLFLEHFLGHHRYQKYLGKIEKKLLASVADSAAKRSSESDFKILEYQKGEWNEPCTTRITLLFSGVPPQIALAQDYGTWTILPTHTATKKLR